MIARTLLLGLVFLLTTTACGGDDDGVLPDGSTPGEDGGTPPRDGGPRPDGAPPPIPDGAVPGTDGGPITGAYDRVEGFGSAATGGTGGASCVVTSSAESGPGTLSDCIEGGDDRIITFEVDTAGIESTSYVGSNVTIDGCAGGRGGVTLDLPSDQDRAIVIETGSANVIVRCLRFEGSGLTPSTDVEADLLAIDGGSMVLVDQCTFIRASDGALDITGDVSDVTVQRSLFYGSSLTMLIKYDTRDRLSIHHNVMTGGGERHPQVTGDVRYIDFVSNIIHDWSITSDDVGNSFSPYGTRIWHDRSDSAGPVNGNFVHSAWLGDTDSAIEHESFGATGTVYFGDVHCPGCSFGPEASAPVPLPAGYEDRGVTPTPVARMREELLPVVGSPNRSAEDTARIDAVAAALP